MLFDAVVSVEDGVLNMNTAFESPLASSVSVPVIWKEEPEV